MWKRATTETRLGLEWLCLNEKWDTSVFICSKHGAFAIPIQKLDQTWLQYVGSTRGGSRKVNPSDDTALFGAMQTIHFDDDDEEEEEDDDEDEDEDDDKGCECSSSSVPLASCRGVLRPADFASRCSSPT